MNPGAKNVPPFPPAYRASGILLHVTSLPSPYGVGDVGPTAVTWIDRLAQAGQRWWQMLPLGPTGYGNSPYQSLSSFAGNSLLVSPDWLIEDELLQPRDVQAPAFPQNKIEYGTVIPFKLGLLERAWAHFKAGARTDLRPAYEQFRTDHAEWLEDYALFRALKVKFSGAPYLEWPIEIVKRGAVLDEIRHELANKIDQICFGQFLLFRQSDRLKQHARKNGISLIGDLPFFVSPDSSDVWAYPEYFLLDENYRPRVVAGVPPDYFSAQGQLWGNPIYNWDALRKTGYRWSISRLQALLAHVEVIRLDHFRGFAASWHTPNGAPAQAGKWVAGPGADFFTAAQSALGALPVVAEDLGQITPDVYALRDQFHLPGTRVLQFAFDGDSHNPYLPSNYDSNTAVYTGTHDNPTTRGWFDELPDDQRKRVSDHLKLSSAKSSEAAPALMELAWSSIAALSIAPLQDLLNLGNDSRMNFPGRPEGNWTWRCTADMLSDSAFERLGNLTKKSSRSWATPSSQTGNAFEAVSKN